MQATACRATRSAGDVIVTPGAGESDCIADCHTGRKIGHLRRRCCLYRRVCSHTCLSRSQQSEATVANRLPAKETGFSVSFDAPLPASATALFSSPMFLYLLAEDTGYSQYSYYTTLGLFLMSFPGLYSLVMRAPKAKARDKCTSEADSSAPPAPRWQLDRPAN